MNETEKDKGIKDVKAVLSAKVQKLTSAVYLVTDFLSDRDPLKRRLRDRALEVLTQPATHSIGQLISLIEVALSLPGVSQMNFSLLKKEYEETRDKMLDLSIESSFDPNPKLQASPSKLHLSPLKLQAPSSKLHPTSNSRRDTIITFVKNHGWSSIKEIAQTMPQVSAKTVQRELAEMVQSGVLKREGDRRWSRYELASR